MLCSLIIRYFKCSFCLNEWFITERSQNLAVIATYFRNIGDIIKTNMLVI